MKIRRQERTFFQSRMQQTEEVAVILKLVVKSLVRSWLEYRVHKITVIMCHRALTFLSNSQELNRTKRSDRIIFFATVIDHVNDSPKAAVLHEQRPNLPH